MYFEDSELDEIASGLGYFSGSPEDFWSDYSVEELRLAMEQQQLVREKFSRDSSREPIELLDYANQTMAHYFEQMWGGTGWKPAEVRREVQDRLESQGRTTEAEALGLVDGGLRIPEVRYEYDEEAGTIEELIETVERVDPFENSNTENIWIGG